jgi:hypothetical protein
LGKIFEEDVVTNLTFLLKIIINYFAKCVADEENEKRKNLKTFFKEKVEMTLFASVLLLFCQNLFKGTINRIIINYNHFYFLLSRQEICSAIEPFDTKLQIISNAELSISCCKKCAFKHYHNW